MAEGGGPHAPPKFFRKRGVVRALQEDNDAEAEAAGFADTVNVPPRIAAALRTKLATLEQLQTVYSLRDMYDLIEVAAVDGYNRRQWEKLQERKNKQDR